MNAKKAALIGLVALTLAACGEATPEERARINAIMPEGCKLYEGGRFGSIENLVWIQCERAAVTTTNLKWSVSSGKSRSPRYAAIITPTIGGDNAR